MNLQNLIKSQHFENVVSSLTLVLGILLLHVVLRRIVLFKAKRPEGRLRWQVNIRTWLLLALFVGLVAIWAEALRTFAITITAVAVAGVIATKELFECISGYLLR